MSLSVVNGEGGKRPASPLRAKPYKSATCACASFEIDARDRTVECVDCGKFVDPLNALIVFTGRFDEWDKACRAAESEASALRGVVADLKRQVRNEQARLRRLAAKHSGPNLLDQSGEEA